MMQCVREADEYPTPYPDPPPPPTAETCQPPSVPAKLVSSG
jgi:hypothetical protein